MNIQRKNSAHHFRMQSEREQTLVHKFLNKSVQAAIEKSKIHSLHRAIHVAFLMVMH